MNRRTFSKLTIASGLGLGLLATKSKAYSKTILYGDGKHDDTQALQDWVDGKDVYSSIDRNKVDKSYLPCGEYKVSSTIIVDCKKTQNPLMVGSSSFYLATSGWKRFFGLSTVCFRFINF
jgi:hypothetical protein